MQRKRTVSSYPKRAAASTIAIAAVGLLAAGSGVLASSRAHAATAGGLPQTEALQVAERVAANWVRGAKVGGEVDVSIAQTTFSAAQAVIEGKAPDEGETGGAAPVAQLRAEPVYLIVLTAGDGTRFSPPEPVPRGAEGPEGKVADLLVTVNTGQIVGEALWVSPPSLAQLGAITETTIPASATTADRPNGALTVVEGSVYEGSRTVKGWRVLVGKPKSDLLTHATRESATYLDGFYSLKVLPGSYKLGVETPNGTICTRRFITVRESMLLKVNLRCR
jgi:hypothetical protein